MSPPHRFLLLVACALAPAPAWPQAGDADFQYRCTRAGVIRCYGFDDLVDLTTGHPRTLTEPDDSTSSRMYDPWGGPDLCTNARCWALDTAVKASGAGALRFEIPSNSPSDTSGSFRINFRDDFSVQIGAGEEFYVQYRERFSPQMLRAFQTTDGHPSGWKQSIVGLGDRVAQPIAYSCTAEEISPSTTPTRARGTGRCGCCRTTPTKTPTRPTPWPTSGTTS